MILSLKVAKIKRETIDTITVCMRQPGLKKIKYKPGQYITLVVHVNGRKYLRPYSFSSCPGIDEFLEITVKRVANGVVSNHINDMIKEGDTLEVMPPMGDFVYNFDKKVNTAYFWGVGSGITPLLSLLKSILYSAYDTKVLLIYGNRERESTIFFKELEDLQNHFQNRFRVIHFNTIFTVNSDNPLLIQGRINPSKVRSIISEDDSLNESIHYICGPLGLKESVKQVLLEKNVGLDRIFSEDFVLWKNPKDFENIVTRNVTVQFNGESYLLEVVKGKSILEAALDANLDLPYSCQIGDCNTCKGSSISGLSKMIGLDKDRKDLKLNEFLLCCTHPLTDNVVFKI